MKHYTKILSVLLVLLLVLAGCSSEDTGWVAQIGEDSIAPGVYLVELMMGYNEASSQLYGVEDILKETIDDLPATQYITNYAKEECAKLLAVRQEFAVRGLTMGDDDKAQADAYTDYLYQIGETFYKANGVDKDAVQYINNTTMMSLAVFNSIYGEGGEKEVPRSQLEQAFAGNYTRSQYILFPKVDVNTGLSLSEEELEAAKTKAEECYQKVLEAGVNFTDLLYQNAKEQDPDTAGERMNDSNYDTYLENNAGYYPAIYEETVLAAADNEIKLVEDDYYYYIIKKLPVLEGDEQLLANYLDATLQNMKYDEYMETLAEWGKALEVKYNNAALTAFSAANLKMTQDQINGTTGESGSNANASSDADTESSPESPAE